MKAYASGTRPIIRILLKLLAVGNSRTSTVYTNSISAARLGKSIGAIIIIIVNDKILLALSVQIIPIATYYIYNKLFRFQCLK